MTGPQGPQGPQVTNTNPSQTTGWPQTAAGPSNPIPPGAGGMTGGAGYLPGMLRPGGLGGAVIPDGPLLQQPSVEIASYESYGDAQRAVDYLSDRGFPVQYTSIVGTGLHSVEQVLGRMTTSRAALSGAGAGAWLGLLIGLLLGLFAVGGWLAVVLTALGIGAVWGAVLGAVAHAASRGQRDFSSRSRLEASQYAVNVTQHYADDARRLLAGLHGNH